MESKRLLARLVDEPFDFQQGHETYRRAQVVPLVEWLTSSRYRVSWTMRIKNPALKGGVWPILFKLLGVCLMMIATIIMSLFVVFIEAFFDSVIIVASTGTQFSV